MTGDAPIYRQIEAYLIGLIDSGGGREEPLPSEPDLAAHFGVSRMTARQAYQGLVAAGLVVRRRRLGSFATGHVTEQLPIEGIPDFQGWLIEGEAATSRRILEVALVRSSREVALTFGVRAGTRVARISLLRKRGNVLCLDTRFLPAQTLPHLSVAALERRSIVQVVAEAGYVIDAGNIEIDARGATVAEATTLGVQAHDPILERRVKFMDADGRCFLSGTSLYPGGKMFSFRIGFRAPAASGSKRKKVASET